MRIRKLLCIGLSVTLLVSAAACGSDTPGPSASAQKNLPAAAEADSAASTSAALPAGADAAAGEEIAPEDISVTWKDSHVYTDLTLGRYDTITTYGVEGYEDVPFIKASDYLNILFEGKQKTAMRDGVLIVEANGTEAVIDPSADTIRFDNPSRLRAAGVINGAIVEDAEYNVVTASTKNKSLQTEAAPVIVSLKEYHMPVIAYENDILLPFLALQNTFGCVRMNNQLAYNGRDYYNAIEANSFVIKETNTLKKDSPYMKALYSGPFSEKEETTPAYAEYGYYSTCLLLDLSFGHKEEKNITTFDEYFTRMKAKEVMCSTEPSSAMTAEFLLFNYLFDSGHDTLLSPETVFGKIDLADQAAVGKFVDGIKSSEEGANLFEQSEEKKPEGEDILTDSIVGILLEKGFKVPDILSLLVWGAFFDATRPEEYGDERLDYYDDTAVIFFNSFEDDTLERNPSYYLDPVNEKDSANSSFAFFYNCFEDIKKHDEVKNVVINISDNGGGNATGLISILGFLSPDGEVRISDQDILAGNYREEYYHVDTNVDGIADDQDGFGGQYDFYIMCSGSSYSCANALPYFAQQNGLATIIGAKPGGGDCVLASFVDAYGHCAYYSGSLKLGTDDGSGFVSAEKATEPDLNMIPSIWDIIKAPWYDPQGIADAVHQYQNGTRELVYDDKGEDEKMSDFLAWLLEKIAEKAEKLKNKTEQTGPENTQE